MSPTTPKPPVSRPRRDMTESATAQRHGQRERLLGLGTRSANALLWTIAARELIDHPRVRPYRCGWAGEAAGREETQQPPGEYGRGEFSLGAAGRGPPFG